MSDFVNPLQKVKNINKLSMAGNLTATTEELTEDSMNRLENLEANANADDYAILKQTKDMIVKQLMMVSDSQQTLEEAYPNLVHEAQEKKASLEKDANRSGKDKLRNDFFATKKIKAKTKLKRLSEDKKTYDAVALSGQQNIENSYLTNRLKRLKRLRKGAADTDWCTKLVAYAINGSKSQRRDTHPVSDYNAAIEICNGEEITINGPNMSKLRGHKFSPDEGLWNGKTIVYYTGAGDAGCREPGVGDTIQKYVEAGFKVYQIDYRGYGKSGYQKEDGTFESHALTERRFYADGDAILNGVLSDVGGTMDNIIIHGFSMGGSIASHVAAQYEENLEKRRAEGEPIHKSQRLGGIVLDSPMKNIKFIAKRTVGSTAAGIAQSFSGKFSTEDHLGVLCQHRPDIPILFVSGDKTAVDEDGSPAEDFSTLDDTKVHLAHKFKNTTHHVKKNSAHLESHITTEMITQKFLNDAGD